MNKKRKIVLASLLKPVNDPRMFEKMGRSLAETTKYRVNIIGFFTKNIPDHPGIRFFPVFSFKRLSLARLLAPVTYGQILLKVKPEVIVVNSHDLLIVSIGYKILFGCRVIYDVQENYRQNIIWSSDLPSLIRYPLAWAVRAKERLCSRMIVHFFLAERCYLNECSFIKSPYTLLENKVRALPASFRQKRKPLISGKGPVRFIYSGTIAESYGIFDCLQLIQHWREEGYDCSLQIIGYCPRADTLQQIRLFIADKPYITLSGGATFVPHAAIKEALLAADMALIPYRLNPSNQHCLPTRIWECLAYKVPMLMREEHPWKDLLKQYNAGLTLPYTTKNTAWPFKETLTFYQTTPIPDSFYWEAEEKKLLQALDSLF